MSNESKALELADEIETRYRRGYETQEQANARSLESCKKAAAELRRQHAEIESLRAQLAARVPEAVVASALFDFGGYLTTLEKSVSFGSYENASPMVEHLQEWARIRGLSLDKADVIGWPDMLSAAPSQQAPVAQGEHAFLVATGEVHNGMETYTRHFSPPPLCEYERLYTHPQQASEPMTPERDAFTVNFIRLAGLDKHKARECAGIALQVIAAHNIKGKQ